MHYCFEEQRTDASVKVLDYVGVSGFGPAAPQLKVRVVLLGFGKSQIARRQALSCTNKYIQRSTAVVRDSRLERPVRFG